MHNNLSSLNITVCGIQHFSLFNGPGIRTTVFFKGCPMRCQWCCNPESQEQSLNISYNKHVCIGLKNCGKCLYSCTAKAIYKISEDTIGFARDVCLRCGECTKVCPSKAFQYDGEILTIQDIMEKILRDAAYISEQGGVTLSGGEPFMRPKFTTALLELCRENNLHTAIETCGFFDLDDINVRNSLHYVDILYYDIKHTDDVKHKQGTGLNNTRILQNLRRIGKEFPNLPIVTRTAIIPGFNDSLAEFANIAHFAKTIPNVKKHEILTSTIACTEKYMQLGLPIPYYLSTKLEKTLIEKCKLWCDSIDLTVEVLV